MKKVILLVLLGIHLTILASGMVRRHLITSPALFEIKKYYQMLTAAGASYGFFSPNIPNQFLVRYEIAPGGRKVSLSDLVTKEVALRVGNMNRFFAYKYDNEDYKRSIAASLTVPIFDRFPDASSITFISEMVLIPPMEDFNKGEKPSVHEIYRATFTLPKTDHD